jgi:hypothetical protein
MVPELQSKVDQNRNEHFVWVSECSELLELSELLEYDNENSWQQSIDTFIATALQNILIGLNGYNDHI